MAAIFRHASIPTTLTEFFYKANSPEFEVGKDGKIAYAWNIRLNLQSVILTRDW